MLPGPPHRTGGRGFTLVELMIVVVVIGILAAIALPNFMAMRERASEAGVKTNMHTVQLHAEDYGVLHDGVFSAVMDGSHIGDKLPQRFANPYDGLQGPGKAYEDRAVFVAPPTATTGIVSYADSATQTYNVKGQAKGTAIPIVLSCSQ